MNEIIRAKIEDKNVLILGFGREGRSTLKKIMEVGGYKTLTVSDIKDVSDDLPSDVSSVSGSSYLDVLDSYDVVFKSPGIVLKKKIDEYKCEFTSETDIFIERFRDKIIGITGTKGKSTTSSLLYHVLKETDREVLFAGNIGIPVFDIASEVTERSVIVLELSCHQLEYAKFSPHKAVLLNIYEDHLDHYKTRERYALAKKNIFLNQSENDILFVNHMTFETEVKECPSKVLFPDDFKLPFDSFEDIEGCKLEGAHNLSNALFVYMIATAYGVTDKEFVSALRTFEPLPHRLQNIGCINGVDYYDDSISTTVKSTISAVESIKNAAILLVGGMERNIAYEELVDYLKSSGLKYIICMYESGARFYEMYQNADKGYDAPTAILTANLEEAVTRAKELSEENEAVLLSPAAASYGYFKNFEERGEVFASLVKKSN